MDDLKGKSLEELKEICSELGFSKFKAKDIFKHIHRKLIKDLNSLTTIKLAEREKLKELFHISNLAIHKKEKGRGVVKVSFQLDDGKIVETVFMDYGSERKTLCISSQVGCPVGCGFCATGDMGFTRNLTTAEILSQVYHFAEKDKISNIVFMGMGEPFLNFDNVIKAAKILNNEAGQNIASRKIVISTIGILAGIRKFAQESKQLRLAWSLVAPNDALRQKLIPFKGLASIKETITALKDYQKATKRRITIEYVVLKGVNDSQADIKELAKIAARLDSHINLIPYNNSPGSVFESGDVDQIRSQLKKINQNINVTIRNSLGQDISAACGQLATLIK